MFNQIPYLLEKIEILKKTKLSEAERKALNFDFSLQYMRNFW